MRNGRDIYRLYHHVPSESRVDLTPIHFELIPNHTSDVEGRGAALFGGFLRVAGWPVHGVTGFDVRGIKGDAILLERGE